MRRRFAQCKLVSALRRDQFLRATSALAAGNVLAQGLALAALPLLTRIYSATDFSVLSVYVAILTMVAAVTSLRLDTAIPISENDEVAVNLLILALISTAIVTVISALVILLAGDVLTGWVRRPEITPYLWLVPFGIALSGVYSAFQFMSIRYKNFFLVARTKVVQVALGLGAQVGMGLAGLGPVGLLLGHALISGIGGGSLARCLTQRGIFRTVVVNRQTLGQVLYRYRRFPQYSVAEEWANNAGMELPIILIAALVAGPEVGYLFLAIRVVGAPLSIIGGAVSQVYYAHAIDYDRQGTLAQETVRIYQTLSNYLVIPLCLLVFFAPALFGFAFGSEWRRAGEIVIWMLPCYVMRLMASPISMVMNVRMKQRELMALTIAGMFLRVGPLWGFALWEPACAIAVFAISNAIYYGALLIVFLRIAGVRCNEMARLFVHSVMTWGMAGIVSLLLLKVASCE